MTTLMECGHTANATDGNGNPICVIDAGTVRDAAARTVAPEPDLTGRVSECVCGRRAHSDGTTLEGVRTWRGPQPFLKLNPEHDGVTKFDSHYCGHAGWD